MKKIFALAAIALFTMTSCSDDDSSSNNNNTNAVLVKKTIETSPDGTLTTNYHYDGNKLMHIEMSDDSDINFTYTNGKVTKLEYKVSGVLEQRNEYSYDNQGRLASLIEYIFDEEMNAEKTLFTYNANGTVALERYAGTHTSQTEPVEEGTVTIANGNIMEYTSDSGTYTYQFDTKNNPEKNIFAVDILNLGWQEGGVNNIISYSDDWGESYTKTYTYNSDNYPVTSEEDYDGEITTTQYFYE